MWELALSSHPFFLHFCCLDLYPAYSLAQKKGIPAGLSVLLLILLFAFIVAILSMIVVRGTIQFGNKIPIYQTNLVGFIDTLTHYFPPQEDTSLNPILRSITSIMISLMRSSSGLVNTGTTVIIIIFTTAFLLIDASNDPEKNSKLEK